ncbi:MAG TPA: 3-hydroxyacyl-CoA dehydrogenase family protein [Panacibacter sp.]|nr:3-hydroxyacyl-CoA dehydrogenase family protein [Panacibacter sp.]
MQPIFATQQNIMRIVVSATEIQKEEWLQKPMAAGNELVFINGLNTETDHDKADVFFDLDFNENSPTFFKTDKPVFVNAVISVLDELPSNYIRINAWSGFLKRDITEVAAAEINKPFVALVMQALNCKYILAPDEPGMIAARTISMIINEAYFALGDEVSTKAEIDIAMKLGTNYPYGPFEWSEKIGLEKIYFLLKKLSEKNERYAIAPLLQEEALKKI